MPHVNTHDLTYEMQGHILVLKLDLRERPDTMTISIKSKKIFAGEYEIASPQRPGKTVRVVKVRYPNDGEYWIADPDFDHNTSDPVFTKREAVQSAQYMLETY